MNTKRKGSDGERELCAWFEAHGLQARRNDQRDVGGYDNPDISVLGLEGYHIECKRVEHLNIHAAFKQAASDSAGKTPVVIHRRNREKWLITMPLEAWIQNVR